MSQANIAVNESGYGAPASVKLPYWSTYLWLKNGKTYRQQTQGTGNDWVEITNAGSSAVPPLDKVLTAGNLSGANPIKMANAQAVEFGSEDTKIVNVGADIHKHAETSVVHVGSESLLTAGFNVMGTATSCVGGIDVTTYQVFIERSSPSSTVSNMYAMAGTVANPMIFPSAAQTAIPFGANTGGTNPSFWPVANNCSLGFSEFDSWLTIGITLGDVGSLGNIGIDFNSWGYSDIGAPGGSGISATNGSVFWMSPDSGPTLSSDEQVVVAQITLPTATDWSIAFLAQGRSLGGGGDWNEYVELTKSQGTSGGIQTKVTTTGEELNITPEDTELPKSYMSPNGVSGVVDVNGLITRTLENSTTATTYSQVDTGGSTLGSLTLQYGPSSDDNDKILMLPNTVSGTIALLSDITGGGSFLPLDGGTMTGEIIMGVNQISSSGNLSLKSETSTLELTSSLGNNVLHIDYSAVGSFQPQILTVRNQSGEIALVSDITTAVGDYLPLAGGTLTGNLNSVDVIPVLANTHDLGTAALFYKQAYISGIDAGSNRSLVLTTDNFDIRLDSADNVKLQSDGNISLEPQLAGSQIQFQKDHGNIGDVWTSTDANGAGHWAAPAAPVAAYTSFIANINDFGTPGSPTMIILENTLSGTPVLSTVGVADFRLTLAETFTTGYTTVLCGPLQGPNYVTKVGAPSEDYVNWFTGADGQMLNMTIEIRVYPAE